MAASRRNYVPIHAPSRLAWDAAPCRLRARCLAVFVSRSSAHPPPARVTLADARAALIDRLGSLKDRMKRKTTIKYNKYDNYIKTPYASGRERAREWKRRNTAAALCARHTDRVPNDRRTQTATHTTAPPTHHRRTHPQPPPARHAACKQTHATRQTWPHRSPTAGARTRQPTRREWPRLTNGAP